MLRVAVRVARAQSEIVLAELLELAPAGVEEVDIDAGSIEYAVYGSPGELPELPALRAVAGDALIDISTTEIADDWAERWRDFHQPLVLGRRLSVRPPWEAPLETELDLVIDPGRAFGTGAHATTRLCLELLLEIPVAGGPLTAGSAVVDLGCGSGVLAIAAARLGHGPVLALDYDPVCIEATAENARENGVRLEGIRRFDLRSEQVPEARLVLANLLAPLLLLWAERLCSDGAERPRQIIASGLLTGEADEVAAAFARVPYAESRRLERGQWAALLLSRLD
jgi:ribosomal protein L11 methyltransferase